MDLLKSAVRLAASGARRAAAGAEDGETRARQVLVADDSVTSRMLLKNILESAGYHVTTAVDGAEAFATLRGGDFDVVVSDVEMPRMNGFEFTAKIRADKKFSELPVVLVTALSSREDHERGVDVGANAYIVKSSFNQSNLLEVIRRLV
jgi:two-component system chemotaxis sensor kinase CheA